MIVVQAVLWFVVVLLIIRRRFFRMRRARLSFFSRHPLAGTDTGLRFATRAPRGVRFHRGF